MSMMVRFKNKITGSEMFVSSERVEEYKAAGHILAADLGTRAKDEAVEVVKVERPATAPKKTTRRKK